MNSTVDLLGRTVGSGHPTFVIAEVGSNHNGDLDTARTYVDESAAAGADAVKFQTIDLDRFLATTIIVDGRAVQEGPRIGAAFVETPDEWYPELFARATAAGIVGFSAPFHLEAVGVLVEAGAPVLKVASGDLTNVPLLREVARTGLPLVVSTGMGDLAEVDRALQVLDDAGARDVVLLHCVSQYPTPHAVVNLRAISTLRQAFGLPVGLSDHTAGPATAVAAVALGACVIEKHVTTDRTQPGVDHGFAMEFAEFADMVAQIRAVEAALGDGRKRPTEVETGRKQLVRRGLFLTRDVSAGTVLTEADLIAMRPARDHITPDQWDVVIGRRAPRDYEAGEPLRWADF